uniref:Uncharacterized protein n=1 Tax=Kalanchoe fedtschenkoi TaxID=63787 RepID=A0A7N1A3P4_KALFE
MGLVDDDLQSLGQHGNQEAPKKVKVTYARDFLLSLSELNLCKQLPNGFDKSILNEFHDAFHGSQEKPRVSGGFAAQNFRRTEYSASPPTRRDANNYARASTGKWESRSRDSDSQSDRDSESGRSYGSHSRRHWQNSEHDGLLGSGSSPKLTGITSGTSVPKFRANDQYQLNKSNAPYQPPRPYKAVPHSRTTTNDMHNDETFGSAEVTTEDQAEERKRRAEFELMRKERYKSSQENQFLNSVESKDDFVFDTTEHQGNLKDENKILSEGTESHESTQTLGPHNGSAKSSTFIQNPAPRPVVPPGFVPPGFANTSIVTKSAITHDTKVQTSKIDDKVVRCSEINFDNEIVKQPDGQSHLNNPAGTVDLLVRGQGPGSKLGDLEHSAAKSHLDSATPLLEDIFGNSLTISGEGLSISTEHPVKLHDKWKGSTKESSKFARWFVEDDGKRAEDGWLSEKPINLFSLIGGGPSSGINSLDAQASKTNEASCPVLTCEDLEQSILSELSHHKIPSETPPKGSENCDLSAVQPKAAVDALASQHLLSVLHKGPGPNDMPPSLSIGKGSSDRQLLIESSSMGTATDGVKQGKVGITSDMSKNPTLEALFGSAFMKELQAVDAPVSTKRDTFISDSSRFQLREDESSNSASDPLNPSNPFPEHVDAVKDSGYLSSHLPVGNPDRLGALSAMFRDGRYQSQDNLAFPYNAMDHNNTFHNIHAHTPSSQFPSPHMSQGRSMFNQSDAHHATPQMRFPDNLIRREPPSTHQFPPSRQMFHQPAPMGFEPPSQQPMIQPMHMQGNVPPPHLLRQYSGNVSQPSHPYNQVLGFRQDLDPMQGFHIGRQQPGFGGHGMSPPGNHHPDALQRFMEMEMRSKPKPNHPFSGHLGGMPNF